MRGPIPFGSYELLERIAEGGMAELWRARSRGAAGFEKVVAIKRVLPSLLERPGFAELLIREAKIAARLSHPNIIQIFDLGEQDGSYYIAMELLRGRDLAAALSHASRGHSPLTLPLRLWIAAEVAKALDYAHRATGDDGAPLHIVHRDVSPQNVLLGFEGEVKVADFGIARADEPGLGRGEDPSILRGKYAYMSPEQARGEPLDRRSDLFSFSILLYELSTKRRMFRGRTGTETLELVRAGRLPDYTRGLPLPELAPILERGLAPRPQDRFRSAGEMHGELMRLLRSLGEPVGPSELGAAMRAMFPPRDRKRPNKLSVDVLARAYEDATASSRSVHGGASPEPTRALPLGSRAPRELRRLVFLVAPSRPGDERLFEAAVAGTGGVVLAVSTGMRLAAYGLTGMERAVGHAARGALELRHASRVTGLARLDLAPPLAIVAGEARIASGETVVPDEAVTQQAATLLGRTDPGDIRVAGELVAELGRDFHLRRSGSELLVERFRSRKDRGERLSTPLVGRRDLLRSLVGMLADAARGKGAVVHLVGEAGVGKSRLLAELCAAVAPRSFVFVHGRADEASESAELRFGVLADLAADLAGVEPEDTPAQRFEKVERLGELGLSPREVRTIGELLGLAYPRARRVRVGRTRGVEIALALRRAVRALARDRGVVLVIEDAHWIDGASFQVLPLLIDELARWRVLVLITSRPGMAPPLRVPALRREVPPLDREASGELLAHTLAVREVDLALAEYVHRQTGGIPAWIELMAEPLRARVQTYRGIARLSPKVEQHADTLPEAIRNAVAARLERLRPRERSLLRASAALGGSAEVRVLSAIEGLVGETARPEVQRLLAQRLWISEDVQPLGPTQPNSWGVEANDAPIPTRVRVPSELLCRAVLAELDESELTRLHARIVVTLERLGAADELEGLERLAEHAALSAQPERAVEFLSRAAERASSDQPARAARHWNEAVAILRSHRKERTDEQAFELALRATDIALEANELEEAERALATLVELPASGELALRRALSEAKLAGRTWTPERVLRALAPLEPSGWQSTVLGAEALAWHAWALVQTGAPEAAIARLEAGLEHAKGAARGVLLGLWAAALAAVDRLPEADNAVSEALAVAAGTGDGRARFMALAAMASVSEARGEVRTAAGRYLEAAQVAAQLRRNDVLPEMYAHAALLAIESGDDDAAMSHAVRARAEAAAIGQVPWGMVAQAIEKTLIVRAERGPGAIPALVTAIESLERRPRQQAMAIELLSTAHRALADPAAAVRCLGRAATIADGAGLRSYARRLRERSALLDVASSPT